MASASQLTEFDQKVRGFLAMYLGESPHYRDTVIDLWKRYLDLGLPNRHFVTELTSGKRERFFQRLWEMLLARHLDAQGYQLTSLSHDPDFRFMLEERIVWVEAISPGPRGIPADWMEPMPPNTSRVTKVPHDEIALRWTAAFKEKWDKLNIYQQKGIVREENAYVIAIHGGQLGSTPIDHGISRYPLALEIVFPIGPLAIPVDQETGKSDSR